MSEENPLSIKWLKAAQDRDQRLQSQLTTDPAHYHRRVLSDTEIICYQPENGNWKICLTDENVDASLEFMHKMLCYPGRHGLFRGMRVYHHPQLRRKVNAYNDDVSQKVKTERGFGHLGPRDVTLVP